MTITPPSFKKDAVPSTKGWHHPKTNELLKATKHTQTQLDEFNGIAVVEVQDIATPIIEVTDVIEPEEITIDSTNDIPDDLEAMTKRQLETFAREQGVELDRRLSRKKLLEQASSLTKE